MKLSEKLVKLRKESGMTQDELAEKLFVTRTAVSKWENDKGYPAIDSLKLLSRVYGVSLDELVSDEDVHNVRAKNQRRSRIYYWCAMGCLAAAVALAIAVYFSGIPWLTIPLGAVVVGYVVFAFFLRVPLRRGMERREYIMRIVSHIVVVLVVATALITMFLQQFA